MSDDRMDELYHYGVKGMKWGKWNSETTSRYLGIKTKKPLTKRQIEKIRQKTLESNDPKIVEKGMKLLTDEELRNKINRMELENRVVSLRTKQEKDKYEVLNKKREAGQKTLRYALANQVGKDISKQTVNEIKKVSPLNVKDETEKKMKKQMKDTNKRTKKLMKQIMEH